MNDDKYWFALYTKPRHEFKAAEQLKLIDVEHYLPVVSKMKQWSDRKKLIKEPVISSYIFIRGDEKDRLESLQQDAIIRCLFENGRPAKIPDWQIESLRLMLDSQSDFYVKNGLVPGQKVKINDGPFKGITGVIQYSENEKTIAVSIDLLKRSILAHLPRDSKFEIIKD